MPYIPPDPGRVAEHLSAIRQALAQLEQLYAEANDRLLAMLIGELRGVVARIENHVKAGAEKQS